jgi:predicted nucleic acid-binding protein
VIVLDASVLIAYLNGSDPHHARSTRIFEEHCTVGFTVHPINLAEVLVGHARRGTGDQVLSELVDSGMALAPERSSEPLMLANLRATTGLRLPDCCVLAAAQATTAALATFDERLAAAARDLGITVVA